MAKTQQVQMKMQKPNFSVSKGNQEKALKVMDNFLNAAKKTVKSNLGDFSTLKAIFRFITKNQDDPADKYVLETVNRMTKDKLHQEIALYISEVMMSRLQDMQKAVMFRMLPYLLGAIATAVIVGLISFTRPLELSNPALIRYLIALGVALPLFIWGWISRNSVKVDLTASNILLQASSAYATAKMQGKGAIAAMQNLGEMKRRAKKK